MIHDDDTLKYRLLATQLMEITDAEGRENVHWLQSFFFFLSFFRLYVGDTRCPKML